jgi:hypothetical protein
MKTKTLLCYISECIKFGLGADTRAIKEILNLPQCIVEIKAFTFNVSLVLSAISEYIVRCRAVCSDNGASHSLWPQTKFY